MRIGLFYASNTGETKEVAAQLKNQFGPKLIERFENIEKIKPHELTGYDVLVLGISTWDVGDLPYDWALFYDSLDNYDFSGTKVVFFGLGDQVGYPETFLDAMGTLYRGFLRRGATGKLGFWSTADYQFSNSLAVYKDKFCGLAIDQDNQPSYTSNRLRTWCMQLKKELQIVRLCEAVT